MDKHGLEELLLRLGKGRAIKLTPAEAGGFFKAIAAAATASVLPAHGDPTVARRLDRLLRGDLQIVARMAPDGRLRVRLAERLPVRATKTRSTSIRRAVRVRQGGAFGKTAETMPVQAPSEAAQSLYDASEQAEDFGDSADFGESPQGRAGDDEPY